MLFRGSKTTWAAVSEEAKKLCSFTNANRLSLLNAIQDRILTKLKLNDSDDDIYTDNTKLEIGRKYDIFL